MSTQSTISPLDSHLHPFWAVYQSTWHSSTPPSTVTLSAQRQLCYYLPQAAVWIHDLALGRPTTSTDNLLSFTPVHGPNGQVVGTGLQFTWRDGRVRAFWVVRVTPGAGGDMVELPAVEVVQDALREGLEAARWKERGPFDAFLQWGTINGGFTDSTTATKTGTNEPQGGFGGLQTGQPGATTEQPLNGAGALSTIMTTAPQQPQPSTTATWQQGNGLNGMSGTKVFPGPFGNSQTGNNPAQSSGVGSNQFPTTDTQQPQQNTTGTWQQGTGFNDTSGIQIGPGVPDNTQPSNAQAQPGGTGSNPFRASCPQCANRLDGTPCRRHRK